MDKLTKAHKDAARRVPPYPVRKALREATLAVGREDDHWTSRHVYGEGLAPCRCYRCTGRTVRR